MRIFEINSPECQVKSFAPGEGVRGPLMNLWKNKIDKLEQVVSIPSFNLEKNSERNQLGHNEWLFSRLSQCSVGLQIMRQNIHARGHGIYFLRCRWVSFVEKSRGQLHLNNNNWQVRGHFHDQDQPFTTFAKMVFIWTQTNHFSIQTRCEHATVRLNCDLSNDFFHSCVPCVFLHDLHNMCLRFSNCAWFLLPFVVIQLYFCFAYWGRRILRDTQTFIRLQTTEFVDV